MFTHPGFDPVALALGPVKIHWYGISYLAGFGGAWWLGSRRARLPHFNWPQQRWDDLVFYIIMGVILGGRIGSILFYNFSTFLEKPWTLFMIWQGGMSFHGGLIGVIVAYFLFARKHKLHVFDIADFAAPVIPFGLFTGRIGNFINAELWGAPTDLPWGMVFPNVDALPRHPSMLYEAALEGLVMLAILLWFGSKPRPRMAASGLFLMLYAAARTSVEFVRLPDAHIGYLFGTEWITMGMMLCVPMWLAGAAFLTLAYRKQA